MAVQKLSTVSGSYLGLHSGAGRFGAGDAIATGITNVYDVDVSDFDGISILASLSGAAITDLVLTVFAIDTAGVPHQIALPSAVTPPAQVLVSGNVLAAQQFDVRGITAIRINVKNANAAGQTVRFVDVLGSITGVDF